jgi:hypothetical protein
VVGVVVDLSAAEIGRGRGWRASRWGKSRGYREMQREKSVGSAQINTGIRQTAIAGGNSTYVFVLRAAGLLRGDILPSDPPRALGLSQGPEPTQNSEVRQAHFPPAAHEGRSDTFGRSATLTRCEIRDC